LTIVGIIVVLAALLLLAPTIASTAPVRAIVLGQVNDRLNGRVQVEDWSLGWWSGIRADGVRVFDDRGAQIFEARELSTQLTLLDAISGNYSFGKTRLAGANFVLKIDENGESNFARLIKSTSSNAKKSNARDKRSASTSDESKLPKFDVDFVGDITGTIEQAGVPAAIHLTQGDIAITAARDQPIEDDVTLAMRVGDNAAGSIAMQGKLQAFHGGKIDLDQLSGNQ
jgi:hypothetical protein